MEKTPFLQKKACKRFRLYFIIIFKNITFPTLQVVDDMAIPRILYASFIALFFIIALLLYMVDHILMPNIALAAKVKKTYTFWSLKGSSKGFQQIWVWVLCFWFTCPMFWIVVFWTWKMLKRVYLSPFWQFEL